jgi:hypothetical protein
MKDIASAADALAVDLRHQLVKALEGHSPPHGVVNSSFSVEFNGHDPWVVERATSKLAAKLREVA